MQICWAVFSMGFTLTAASTQYVSSNEHTSDYTLPVMVGSSVQYPPPPTDHYIHPPKNSGYDNGRGQVSYQVSPASNPGSYPPAPAAPTPATYPPPTQYPPPSSYSSPTAYPPVPSSHPEYNVVDPHNVVEPHTDYHVVSSSTGSQNVYSNVINSSPPEEDSDDDDDENGNTDQGVHLQYSSDLYKLVDTTEADMENCLENGQFLPHPFDDCQYKVCMHTKEPWQNGQSVPLITRDFPCPPGTGVSRTDFNENVPCSERIDTCTIAHHAANRNYGGYN